LQNTLRSNSQEERKRDLEIAALCGVIWCWSGGSTTQRGQSLSHNQSRISALKSLVEYAGKQDACSFSLSEIKSLKSQRCKDNPGVSVDDYRSILDLVDRSTDLALRQEEVAPK
jgi:hypothetical protein